MSQDKDSDREALAVTVRQLKRATDELLATYLQEGLVDIYRLDDLAHKAIRAAEGISQNCNALLSGTEGRGAVTDGRRLLLAELDAEERGRAFINRLIALQEDDQ